MKNNVLFSALCCLLLWGTGRAQTQTIQVSPTDDVYIRYQSTPTAQFSTHYGATVYHTHTATAGTDKTIGRYRFTHSGFLNSDIQSIKLLLNFRDNDVSDNDASWCFIKAEYLPNTNAPMNPNNSADREDCYYAVAWGPTIFNPGPTAGPSGGSISQTYTIHDPSQNINNMNLFDPNSNNITIGLEGNADNLKINDIKLEITYNCDGPANAPTNLSTSNTDFQSTVLSWNPVANATGYDVYRNGTFHGSTSGTSLTIGNLSPQTTYQLAVRAKNDCSSSASSNALQVTTLGCVDAPTNFTASNHTTSSMVLTWDTEPNTTYKVYQNSTGTGQPLVTTTSGSYLVTSLSPNTPYTYVIVAQKTNHCDSDLAPLVSRTLPDPPYNVQVTGTETDEVVLSWVSYDNISQHNIYNCGDASASIVHIQTTQSSTNPSYGLTRTITGLSPYTEYSYEVSATINEGESAKSACASGYTRPIIPQNVALTPMSSSSVEITWDANPNATSYEIVDCNNGTVHTSNTNTTVINGLNQGTLYSFRVKTIAPFNESYYTTCYNVTTLPSVPNGLVVAPFSSNSLYLTWTTIASPNSWFEVFNSAGISKGTTTDSHMYINFLSSNTQRSYYVVQHTASNSSAPSTTETGRTYLETPQNLITQSISATELKLTWSDVQHATYYEIYDCNDNYLGQETGLNPGMAYLDVSGLTSGTAYTFKVKAMNSYNQSLTSGCVSGYTQIPAPTNVAADGISSSEIEVTWDPVAAASYYAVYDCNGSFIDYSNSTTYIHSGLSPFTSHIYKIKAIYVDPNQGSSTTNGSASSDFSSCAGDYTLLSPPYNLQTTALNISSVRLQWSSIPNATIYKVYHCDGTYLGATSNLYLDINPLSSGTVYDFHVIAENSVTISETSPCITGTPRLLTPTLFGEAVNSSTIQLTWIPIPGATGYNVHTCSGQYIGHTTSPGYLITGLFQQTSYSYKIQAIYVSGQGAPTSGNVNSDFSSCVFVSTPPASQLPGFGFRDEEINNDAEVKVFPNPFVNELQISSDENIEWVGIYSLDGRLVLEQTNVSRSIQTDGLSAGTYVVKVQTENTSKEFKMIKH